jgi:hypothetical protein
VFPPDNVPAELADTATWTRFATLRARVERDPDALAEVRAVLGPVEAELWDTADAAMASGEAARRAGAVHRAWPLVDAALVKLGA